jgi:hypothetical protein
MFFSLLVVSTNVAGLSVLLFVLTPFSMRKPRMLFVDGLVFLSRFCRYISIFFTVSGRD